MEFNFKNSPYQIGCQKSFYWYQYNQNFWYRDIHTGRADFEKCKNMLVLVAGRKMPFGRSQTLWSLSRSCGMRSRRGTLTTVWAATLSSAGGSASTAAGDGPSNRNCLEAPTSKSTLISFTASQHSEVIHCVFTLWLCDNCFLTHSSLGLHWALQSTSTNLVLQKTVLIQNMHTCVGHDNAWPWPSVTWGKWRQSQSDYDTELFVPHEALWSLFRYTLFYHWMVSLTNASLSIQQMYTLSGTRLDPLLPS